ncbi:MAG TPA: glycosyltransferase [Candidatus Acidoferrum sp.]|nr:glycosyltransferase [Candidatus Acidoferrum sp.]
MNPLVSFVVPCYKLAHLLPECVNSILKQTYQNYEILIMDNCSPDNTPEVATSFSDPRVKHIRNETNLGHVRNFNKGITMARGKYVWLISPDDWLRSPKALARYVDLMERNPGIGYAFCRAVEVQGSKEVGIAQWTDCGEQDQVWEGPSFLKRLIQGNCVLLSAAMVRKECYDKYGMFSLEMPHANDWYLWCVLALHYQVGYLAEPLLFVRMHEESLTSAFNQGGNPLCVIDELSVLWRVARLAELAGVITDRRAFNESIATIAARALTYGQRGRVMPGLSEADLETLFRQYVKDRKDEKDFRACVHSVVGDEEFWHGQNKKAGQAYWLALKLRPWWIRTWTKYLLMRTGGLGLYLRRLILNLREFRADAK